MDWEPIRDAYVQRFGTLLKAHTVKTLDREVDEAPRDRQPRGARVGQALRFFVLDFGSPGQQAGPITYASFGATRGGAGNELFLTAAAPYAAFRHAVEELAAVVPRDLRPLGVVRYVVRHTLFEAMLILPASDGTFHLGELDGVERRVLRLVPITPAERQMAARDPERLVGMLRAARALVTDPLRACVVEPNRDGGRRANTAVLLDVYRRRVEMQAERHERWVAMGEAGYFTRDAAEYLAELRATLAHIEARLPAILPEPDALELLDTAALGARFGALFRERIVHSFDAFAALAPPRVANALRAFLVLALTTHPVVHPIAYEAVMGSGRLPAQDEPDDEAAGFLLCGIVAEQLAAAFPLANERALQMRAKAAFATARSSFAANLEVPWRVHAWSAIVPVVCLAAVDLGPAQGPAAEYALRDAAMLAAHADDEPALGSGPAPTRLARIVSALTRTLLRSYVGAARRTLRERAPRR